MSISLKRLNSQNADFNQQLDALLHRQEDQSGQAEIEQKVADIIADVRRRGDEAVKQYTINFDGVSDDAVLEISPAQLQGALNSISSEQRDALEYAAKRIQDYHQHQKQESWDYTEADGNRLGQKITPLKRVGLYVPGGKASYPSSVLMNAIPAKVAGVQELIMVSPTPNGETNQMVLAAAAIAGVDKVFAIGGAQAVAALAYGTDAIPMVDKIVGPGNIFVATAKKQVFGQVGIDMIAGPSEVCVIADNSVNPEWVAMDMFAQAEHDEMAQSILVTSDEGVADAVEVAINKLLPQMERAEIIRASLENNGGLVIAQDQQSLIDIVDVIAPEHLEIFTNNATELAEKISNAGAMFVGEYSAESLGDYCAGPNHVLPTSGTARFSSPLGVYDFQKRTSIIHSSKQAAQTIGKNASVLARGESLTAHARSAEMRLDTD